MAVDNLGLVLRHNGQLTEAIAAHRDAAAIHHETGDRQGEGSALNDLGQALQEEDRYNEAITAHEEAAAIRHEPATGTEKTMPGGIPGKRATSRPANNITARFHSLMTTESSRTGRCYPWSGAPNAEYAWLASEWRTEMVTRRLACSARVG